MNIVQSNAAGLKMNIAMNARSEMIPPINSHFQARANPRSPMANKANCIYVFKVMGEEVPLLALSIVSPINIIKAKATITALKTRAIIRGIFTEFVEFAFIFLLLVIIVLTQHYSSLLL